MILYVRLTLNFFFKCVKEFYLAQITIHTFATVKHNLYVVLYVNYLIKIQCRDWVHLKHNDTLVISEEKCKNIRIYCFILCNIFYKRPVFTACENIIIMQILCINSKCVIPNLIDRTF